MLLCLDRCFSGFDRNLCERHFTLFVILGKFQVIRLNSRLAIKQMRNLSFFVISVIRFLFELSDKAAVVALLVSGSNEIGTIFIRSQFVY